MCDICGQNPCDYRCPNSEEAKPIGHCETCGESLYAFEEGLIDEIGNMFCDEECAMKYYDVRNIKEEDYHNNKS